MVDDRLTLSVEECANMPRGHSRNIEDNVKDAIVKVKKDNRDFSANQIRNHLLREHDKYGLKQEEIPQKRSIQKIVADNISNLREMWTSPQEKPWTLGSLEHNPVTIGLENQTGYLYLAL